MEKSQSDSVSQVGLKTYQQLSEKFDFFSPQTTDASSNSSFWSVKKIDKNKVTLEKQKGAKFSEALEDLLKKGGKIECSLARSVVMNKAIMDQLGAKNFDQFASLYEELSGRLINFSKFQGLADYFLKIPFKQVPYPINSIEGYLKYLSGLPEGVFLYVSNIKPYVRLNHGTGENIISLGNGKFMGFGKYFGKNGLNAEDIFNFLKEEYLGPLQEDERNDIQTKILFVSKAAKEEKKLPIDKTVWEELKKVAQRQAARESGKVFDEDKDYDDRFLSFQRGLPIYEIDPLVVQLVLDEKGGLDKEKASKLILSML